MEGQKKRNAAKDMVVGGLLVIFGIYVIITSLQMKVYNTFIDAPGFFPTIIGSVLTILGAILCFIGVRSGGVAEFKEVMTGTFLKTFIKDDRTLRVLILLGMMIIYMFVLIGNLPFIAATSIYLFANFMYLKACKKTWIFPAWAMAAIIAVVASVVIFYAFKLTLGVTLP